MRKLSGGLLCLFLWTSASAQTTHSKIYDGREYVIIPALISGTPFFKDTENSDHNSLLFDKVLYTGIPLLYDIRYDQLVTTREGELTNMIVVKELVDFFTIGKDTVVNLKESATGLSDGFYLQVFNSPDYKSVARYKKGVKDPRSVNEKRYYFETVEYFMKTPASDLFVPLRNNRNLFSINKQYKKGLKKLLQTQGNREDFQGNIALALDYLNQMTRH